MKETEKRIELIKELQFNLHIAKQIGDTKKIKSIQRKLRKLGEL